MRAVRDRAILVLLTLAALLSFLAPVLIGTQRAGFPLDDGWIHATYARNLAAHGEFALNPGMPSTGTTSLLWTLLLGGAMRAGLDAVTAAWLLGSLSLLLLVAFWHDLLGHSGIGRPASFLAAAALPVSGILVWWTLSGMETTLFLLLGVVSLHRFTRRDSLGTGIALALLLLTRPEGLLLAPVLALGAWRRDRSFLAVWPLLAGAGAGILVYVGWNLLVSGVPYTSTLAGRRWLAHGGRIPDADLLSAPLVLLQLLWRWLRTVGWGILGGMSPGVRLIVAGAAAALLIGAARSAFARRRRGTADPSSRTFTELMTMLALWTLSHAAAYALLLPYPGHAGRYLAPLLLPGAALLAMLIQMLLDHCGSRETTSTRRPSTLVRVLVLALVLIPLAFSAHATWRTVWRSSVAHIDAVHRRAAEWISGHTSPNSRIAAFDIGAIAFFSDRQVVDLGGLADPAAAAYMDGRIDEFILLRRADFTAMIAPYEGIDAEGWIPAALGYGRSALLLRHTVREFHIPPVHYRVHIALTGNAYPRMLIDRSTENLQKHTH